MDTNDPKLLDSHEPLLLESNEQRLRAEIESLKKQLSEEREKKKKEEDTPHRPSKKALWITAAGILMVLILAFFVGWLPRHRRENELKKEAAREKSELPKVDFVRTERSAADHLLMLPGTINAETDSPILARADGYLRKRYVDIGDRVKQGQLMAEIEAPDLDQQVRQGEAQLSQARAAQRQADAALQQGRANEELARVTAARWRNLVARQAVSRQENDTYQANYQAQVENVNSLNQARDAAAENVGAAQANLARLQALQQYEQVRAPFDGVVTVRNIDTGALIATGNTLLFRVAQIDRLRTYIFVPQSEIATVQVGQTAELFSAEMTGRSFPGSIRRTANSLDPTTRTLLTEVAVPNPQRVLLPGMYMQVRLRNQRANPSMLIPGDALIVRANGTMVGVLQNYHKVDPAQLNREEEEDQKEENQKAGKKEKEDRGSKKKEAGQGGQGNGNQQGQGQAKGQNQRPKEVLEGKVHLQPVTVGRDYGNAIEISQGLNDGEIIISNPNDSVREGAQVRATETKPQLDQVIASPNGAKSNANSEQLQKTPGAEPIPQQPSVVNKSRGAIQ